ncbi:MAG: class I SAM-dependent methyltransferase [Kofleriaceae bacterium]
MKRPTFIARQAGHPAGWFGRLLLRVMARETFRFNHEILDTLAVADSERVLEIGFGHGRTLLDAARRVREATLAGIDIAPDAERVASRRCKELIEGGRLVLKTGDAADLPWTDGSFDAVYSVHTIYFWERPQDPLAQVRRVLSKQGRFVLGMRERTDDVASHFPASVYRFYSGEEVVSMLREVGFSRADVRTSTTSDTLRIVTATA